MQFMKQALEMLQKQNIQLKKQLMLTKNAVLNFTSMSTPSQSDYDFDKVILKNQLNLLQQQYNQLNRDYNRKNQQIQQQMLEITTENDQYIDTLRAQLKNLRTKNDNLNLDIQSKDNQIKDLKLKLTGQLQKMQHNYQRNMQQMQQILTKQFTKKLEESENQNKAYKSMIQTQKHTINQEKKHRLDLQQQLQAYHQMLYKQKTNFEKQLTTLQNINTILNQNLMQRQDHQNKTRIQLIQKINQCICQSQIIRQFKYTIKALQSRNEKLQKSNKELASKQKIISKKAIDSINASKKYLALQNQTAKKKQKLFLMDQKNLTKKIKQLQNQSTSKINIGADYTNSGKSSLQSSLHHRHLSQSYTTVPNISLFLLEDIQQNQNKQLDTAKSNRNYQLKLEDINQIDKLQELETPCFDSSRNFQQQLKTMGIRQM